MKKELTSALTWNVLDNLSEGVLISDYTGNIVYGNPAARQLLQFAGPFTSLNNLFQVIAPHKNWRTLLLQDSNSPVEMVLSSCKGTGTIKLLAHPWQDESGDYVQITVNTFTNSSLTSKATMAQLTSLAQISREPDFDQKLHLIVESLKLSGWKRVVLTLRDRDFQATKIIMAGFSPEEEALLRDNLLPASVWQQLFQSQEAEAFRQGLCYFVPGDSFWSRRYFRNLLQGAGIEAEDPTAWQPRDVLAVPLLDRQQNKIGLLGLDQPLNGRRPDQSTLQIIELYAQFAASVIESARLVDETLLRSRELEVLFNATNKFTSLLEKETVLSSLGEQLMQASQSANYTIYQWQPDTNSLVVVEDKAPLAENSFPVGKILPLEEYQAMKQVLTTLEPAIVPVAAKKDVSVPKPLWLKPGESYWTILLPLVLSEVPFGLTAVTKPAPPAPNELTLLQAITKQANKALETAFIFAETFERERFYNALGNVTLAINFALDLEAVLDLICTESQRIFNVDGAYIWLREEGRFIGRAAKGHGESAFKKQVITDADKDDFVNQIAHNGTAMYANHLRQTPNIRFKLPQRETLQAALGVPLEQDGKAIGVLILIDQQTPHRFSDKDVARATIFGAQTAIALRNAQLFEELRQLNDELDTRVAKRTQALNEESNRVKLLLRITSELSASLDHDRVLSQALHLVNEVVQATQGVILLIDQETGELLFRSALGTDLKLPSQGSPSGMMRNEGLAGWMIENRSSVIVHDTRKDPRWVYRPTSSEHRSVLAVPLMTGEEVIGLLMLFHTRPNAFTMQMLELVEAAAIQVANAISNANLYLLIRDQAERLGATLHLEQIETAKNQAILESIADGVVVADQYNKITLANLPASSILGIPKEALLGKSINEFLGLYGQKDNSWLQTIKNWSQNAHNLEQWTYIAEQLSFENKVVSVHLSPVLAGKQFFGTVSIFRDITKEVELDRLKSEFVSTVSHELRTPMTSIKGYVDLMLMGAAGQMSEAQQRYLKVIQNNAERLHMLVNDLLDISRIETGKTQLDLRPVDISLLLEQVVEGHLYGRIQHEGKPITVHTQAPSTLPLVNIDRRRITQVLTNLLDNALNYTPEHGEIRLTAKENGRYVYISVADTGIGISPEDQERIFDRFYRAEHEFVQKIPGTGLGLAIVSSLIEMHGGTLKLESTPGLGSTFTFNLPIAAQNSKQTKRNIL